jgi:transcription elongation factor GreA
VSHFITKQGLAKLQQAYQEIIDIKIPAILEQLSDAMSSGDISENSARDTVLFEQQDLLAKKQEMEEILNDYTLIDEDEVGKSKKVVIGSTVKIRYLDTNTDYVVQIMGISEANILLDPPRISNENSVAVAILGKNVGDTLTIRVKQKKSLIKILEIIE